MDNGFYKVRLGLRRIHISDNICSYKEYVSEVRKLFTKELFDFEQGVEDKAKEMDEDIFYDIHSDRYRELRTDFPSHFRKSTLMFLYTFFESELLKLC
ncbi:MAG: hypothetical protein KAR20_18950, partial [Candidatus Heimdallarchaeota archaeon]|nr:hypothetical protein [Candidatus Heimdallarchaeota archaeon]